MSKVLSFAIAPVAIMLVWAILFFFNLSLNVGWALAGIPAAIVVVLVWGLLKQTVPNPYGEKLYSIRFSDYGFWAHQHGQKMLFAKGDKVLIVPGAPESDEAHEHLIHVREPHNGRESWLPKHLIEPCSNLAAWQYHRTQGH